MRTLLSLFFVPYLRFLLKFHLYAIPVAVLIFLVGVPELMMLIPMIYMFSLYATMNRHQFKENIPWMLATFNKRTLVRYHLLAQTLVLFCQISLSSLMMVIYFTSMILIAPESSDQILPDMTGMQKGAGAVLTKGISPLAGTKEQLLLAVVGVFFLITMYSPVSLKDYLRQLEERRGRKSKTVQALQMMAFVGAGLGLLWLDPAQWLGPLMSLVLVAEIAYVVWIFNRAFTLFHPRRYREGLAVAAVFVVMVSVGVQHLSMNRFHMSASAEGKLAELAFMGKLAPEVSSSEFTAIARELKDPLYIITLMENPHFSDLLSEEQVMKWALDAKELGVALRLIQALPASKLSWLQEPKVLPHLEKLHRELHTRNPASAAWQVSTLERHLRAKGAKSMFSEVRSPASSNGLTK